MTRSLSFIARFVLVVLLTLVANLPLAFAGPPPGPGPFPDPGGDPSGEPWHDPAALPPDTIQASDPSGYLGGNAEVRPDGSMHWSAGVDVPPGRGGLSPSLAVHVTSGGANGILGVGGSLSGFSSISPCGKSLAIDGEVSAADYSKNSRLCLDGAPLVVIDGEYFEDGSEYRTELETFQKITFHQSDPTKPGYFEVRSKSGLISTYEGVQVHRAEPALDPPYTLAAIEPVTVTYLLDTIEDRAGNYLQYHYTVLKNPQQANLFTVEYFCDHIEYTLHKGRNDVAQREVRFIYEPRPDTSFAYVAGVRIQNLRHLKTIELYAPNPTTKEKVGSYHFTYGLSNSTQRSLLSTIERCDGEGVCLWKKRFDWETSLRPDFQTIDLGLEIPDEYFVMARDTGFTVADFDGDGRDEALYRLGWGYFLRRMDASGTPLGQLTQVDPIASAGESGIGFEDILLKQSRAVDLDGDGKSEIVAGQIVAGGYHIFHWDEAAGGLVSTGILKAADLLQDGNGDPYLSALDFGDTRGGGLPSMFDQVFITPTHPEWQTFANKGGLLFEDGVPTGVNAYCGRTARMLDRNGDGLAEIWSGANFGCTKSHIVGTDATGQPAVIDQPGLAFAAKKAILADLNGDGYRDLVRLAVGNGGWVRFSTGVGFGPQESLVNAPHPDSNAADTMDQGTLVVDLNSDGREDLLALRFDPAPDIAAYLSLGDGSFTKVSTGIWPGMFQAVEGFTTTRSGDFNGDGLVDLVKMDLDGHIRVLVQKPGAVDSVVAIQDDLVAEQPSDIFTYSQAWSDAPKPASCTYPQQCVRHGMQVVREHKAWQGIDIGKYRRVQYSYADPRVDMRGRGFLGFGEVRSWDPDLLRETTVTFDNKTRVGSIYPNAGMPKRVREIVPIWPETPAVLPTVVNARVTQIDTTYELHVEDPSAVHWVHASSWKSKEWEPKVKVTPIGISFMPERGPEYLRERKGTTKVDAYGNTTFAERETLGGVYERTETTYFDPDTDAWLISLPKSVSAVSAKSGAVLLPEPRTAEFDYDSRGYLQSVTLEPNSPDPSLTQTTTTIRNGDGLISFLKWQAPGVAARHLYVTYGDPEGMFPSEIENDMGFKETRTYHPAFGVVAVSRDVNGVETRHKYDTFMRPVRVETDGGGSVDFWETLWLSNGWVRGLIQHSASAGGGESYVVANEIGRPVEQAHRAFDGQWSRVGMTYDFAGRMIAETRPALGVISQDKTTLRYDSLDRLLEVKAPDGATRTHAHSFLKTQSWDANQSESFVVYDLDDRIIESTDLLKAKEIPTKYSFDDFGQVERITDAKGNETILGYDKRGRRTSMVDPDRGKLAFGFNGIGELLWEDNDLPQKNSFGKAVSYSYDAIGRLDHKEDVDGVTTFAYDFGPGARGQLTEAVAPDGTKTKLTYDLYARPKATTWTIGGEDYSVETHYDMLGRLDRVTYPDVPTRPGPRFAVDSHYNANGYLEAIQETTQLTPFWKVKSRNADGALTEGQFGNGLVNARNYYPKTGRLKLNEVAASGLPLDGLLHTYYPNGNLHERLDITKNRAEAFEYDALDRLKEWKVVSDLGTRATGYGYDVIGNLTTVSVDQAVTEVNTYGLAGKPHALSTTLLGDYVPDPLGRTTAAAGKSITYNAFDLPKSITAIDNAGATFEYDAFHSRVRKVTKTGSTIFIGGLYERREEVGSPTEHVFYVPGEDGPAVEVHFTEGSVKDKSTYLHEDALGSVRLATDEAGAPVADPMYFEPFGQRVLEDGSPIAQNYTPPVALGFTGHRHDSDLGDIDMRGRLYDPTTRRFYTPDPYVSMPLFGQSFNRFAYVNNNPLNFRDPTGFSAMTANTVLCGETPCVGGVVSAPAAGAAKPAGRSAGGASLKAAPPGAAPTPTMSKADGQENPSSTGALSSSAEAPTVKPFTPIEAPASPVEAWGTATSGGSASEPFEPEGSLEPQSWKDSVIVRGAAGFAYGVSQAWAPGGIFMPSPRPKDRAFEFWRGAGQFSAGVVELFTGAAMAGAGAGAAMGGVAGAPVSGGGSLAVSGVGVGAISLGWAAAVQGAAGVVAGINTLAGSTSLSTGGGGPEKIHKHHVFPQFWRRWFANPKRGIDIDKYTVRLPQRQHLRGVHGKGDGLTPGEWNRRWDDYIRKNDDATADEVFDFMEKLRREFGVDDLPFENYR